MPHDPSALEWLQPPSAGHEDPESAVSAYHPSSEAEGVVPSAIRFSLAGTMLSPSTSLALPTNLGLHHHGNDPQAAGYTIPELAILGRSAFAAQRCIAWQVLGRILFRLGKGEFGERGGTLVDGLWFVIEKEKVVAAMLAEAEGAGGQTQQRGKKKDGAEGEPQGGVPGGFGRHASATAWAVEGVWLWQMGGGGDRGLLKEGVVRSQ
ncbi:transcription factor Rba50 [Aspergillus sp. HF37]|nr:transcription factor Rba50 [Aspergillus sp. HF37]